MIREVIFLVFSISMVFVRNASNSASNYKTFDMFKKANRNFNISEEILELSFLDAPGLITRFGYPVEVHKVTTPDGYILEMHRIPHGRQINTKSGKKPVVFLMHGLLSCSADYVVLGPGVALSLLLADEGYDVWLGNARGNYYSRNHVTLNPDLDPKFWLFSWDEIGHIDLPTSIDYILHLTGENKVHYVGHSQGGTTVIVMNCLRPEYNRKIKSFHGLAPSVYNSYADIGLRFLVKFTPFVEKLVELLGPLEVFNNKQAHMVFSFLLCRGAPINDPKCLNTLQTYLVELANLNTSLLPLFFSNSPAGSSIMQTLHYAQSIRTDTFARYNFDNLTNLNKYGSVHPPKYEIKKFTAPTYLYYGINDHIVHWKNILKLTKNLPNVQQLYRVKSKNFNHLDFIYRSDVKALVYDKVVGNIKRNDSK